MNESLLSCPGNRVIEVTEIVVLHGFLRGDTPPGVGDKMVAEEVNPRGREVGNHCREWGSRVRGKLLHTVRKEC